MRASLRTIIALELTFMLVFVCLALLLPSQRQHLAYVASWLLVIAVLHALLVPYRGWSFVIWDEPPSSPVKYYWFATIAIAAFAGGFLRNAVLSATG